VPGQRQPDAETSRGGLAEWPVADAVGAELVEQPLVDAERPAVAAAAVVVTSGLN
jgi:hypothetical protein